MNTADIKPCYNTADIEPCNNYNTTGDNYQSILGEIEPNFNQEEEDFY